jgi:hypothetical protein
MHDNHTFTRLTGDIDEVIAKASKLGVESTYGMLCPIIVLRDDGSEVRRVGKSAHATVGFDEVSMEAWRTAVLADHDVALIFGAAHARDGHDSGDEDDLLCKSSAL